MPVDPPAQISCGHGSGALRGLRVSAPTTLAESAGPANALRLVRSVVTVTFGPRPVPTEPSFVPMAAAPAAGSRAGPSRLSDTHRACRHSVRRAEHRRLGRCCEARHLPYWSGLSRPENARSLLQARRTPLLDTGPYPVSGSPHVRVPNSHQPSLVVALTPGRSRARLPTESRSRHGVDGSFFCAASIVVISLRSRPRGSE